VATGCDRWRSARAAAGRVQASGKCVGEARRPHLGTREDIRVGTADKVANAKCEGGSLAARDFAGRLLDSDGNERADSRIQVLQPDGTIVRPGPPDIHPERDVKPLRRATSPAK
jgi:hypothetical protein